MGAGCFLVDEPGGEVKELVDVTDSAVAAAIFGDYNIIPSEQNAADDSPTHTEAGHSLMQRKLRHSVPAQPRTAQRQDLSRRLRRQARHAHRLFRKAETRWQSGGHTDPLRCLELAVNALDLEWDAMRPTKVVARQALFSDPMWRVSPRRYRIRDLAALSDRLSTGLHRQADDRAPGHAGG